MEKSKKRKHDKKLKDKKEGFLLIFTKHEKDYSHVYIIYECAYSALPAGTRMSVKHVFTKPKYVEMHIITNSSRQFEMPSADKYS